MNRKTAIVLGGTTPHIELIKQLKARSYYTILIDYLGDSPARSVADVHVRESTLDKEKTIQIAQEYSAALVVSPCVDQANATASYVSEALKLPMLYGYDIAIAATKKHVMKEYFENYGIPTARFVILKNADDCENCDVPYPCIVKPTDSNGSKGVVIVNCVQEAIKAYHEAREISRTGTVIMEEYMEGTEIQVDCFSVASRAHVLMINKKIKLTTNSNTLEMQSSGSVAPIHAKGRIFDEINSIAQAIVDAFQLVTTPFFFQAIIDKGSVKVIEFALRIGGGLSYRMIPVVTKFDTLNAFIDALHGEQPCVNVSNDGLLYSTNNIYVQDCKLGSVDGYQKLIENGVIQEFYPYKSRGTSIGTKYSSNNRVAGFVIKAENEDDMLNKTSSAYKSIVVKDIVDRIVPHVIPDLHLGFSSEV